MTKKRPVAGNKNDRPLTGGRMNFGEIYFWQKGLRPCEVPVAANAVAGRIAGPPVVDPQIKGLAVIGPLLGPVDARDRGKLACLRGI